MKTSSLAERLAEFAADAGAVDAPARKLPHVVSVETREVAPRAPRRLSFDTRRIQIRDTGLSPFRIF